MQMERIAAGYQLVEAPVATDAGAVESEQSEGADSEDEGAADKGAQLGGQVRGVGFGGEGVDLGGEGLDGGGEESRVAWDCRSALPAPPIAAALRSLRLVRPSGTAT